MPLPAQAANVKMLLQDILDRSKALLDAIDIDHSQMPVNAVESKASLALLKDRIQISRADLESILSIYAEIDALN